MRGAQLSGATQVKNQRTPTTGITAIAMAQQMCGSVHVYGFGGGSCEDTCYHYYECGSTAPKASLVSHAHVQSTLFNERSGGCLIGTELAAVVIARKPSLSPLCVKGVVT